MHFKAAPARILWLTSARTMPAACIDVERAKENTNLHFSFIGYERDLPGFPRYSVSGRDRDGVFNLRIGNASVDDDATYECQVGPAPGNRPIRASANLTVLRESFLRDK